MRAKNLAKKINLLVCLAHFADFLFLYGFLNALISCYARKYCDSWGACP